MNLSRAFIEVMTGGDAGGRVFTFPSGHNITPDFGGEGENVVFPLRRDKAAYAYFRTHHSDLDPHVIRLDVLPHSSWTCAAQAATTRAAVSAERRRRRVVPCARRARRYLWEARRASSHG